MVCRATGDPVAATAGTAPSFADDLSVWARRGFRAVGAALAIDTAFRRRLTAGAVTARPARRATGSECQTDTAVRVGGTAGSIAARLDPGAACGEV